MAPRDASWRITKDPRACSRAGSSALKSTPSTAPTSAARPSRAERLHAAGIGGRADARRRWSITWRTLAAAYYTSPWGSRGERARAGVDLRRLRRPALGHRLDRRARARSSALPRFPNTIPSAGSTRWSRAIWRMLPLEHEYKVMGLAPYAAAYSSAAALAPAFLDLFQFAPSGLAWKRARGVPSMYSAFDAVAACWRASASTRPPRGPDVPRAHAHRLGAQRHSRNRHFRHWPAPAACS